MKQKLYVYVIGKKRKPLSPTTRLRRVRKLLEAGLAVPVCNNPFTIRLKYDTPEIMENLYFGVDTGRENIGVAVSNEKGECVFRADVKTNNKQIRGEMDNRRGYRRARRLHKRQKNQRKALRDGQDLKNGEDDVLRHKKSCKSVEFKAGGAEEPRRAKVIRPAEPQINNRQREDGWLTPSARALVQAHLHMYEEVSKFIPVMHINLEFVSFDFQKMQNANIKNWQYSKGPLYGFRDYKEYIFAEQNGKCLLCGCDRIDHYHHIEEKKNGGTDQVCNIAGLCESCHGKTHGDDAIKGILKERKGANLKNFKVSLLNSAMTQILDEFKKTGKPVSVTYGYETSDRREEYGIEKDHCNDAYMVSLGNRTPEKVSLSQKYEVRHFKKKSNNIINAIGKREYLFNGKVVAVNRHKAMDQKVDSLEEYMAKYARTHTQKQCDRHFHKLEIRPAKRVYTYHKDKIRTTWHLGDTILYRKHNKVKGNTKQRVFTAIGIEVKEGKVSHGNGNKNKKAKFCSFLKGGSLAFVQA